MKHTIKQSKQLLGILDAVVTHVVDKTEATIKWEGPKISPEQWREMLAFFKWTYDRNKSESQVRLFVSKDKWAIWAFPQKANTGMAALELDTKEAGEQRELFLEAEGWHYFGTVHHHCGMTAFQSGTDKENEDKIDGLHITIGKMDEAQHDLHARLLIGKQQFEVDLGWFWNIGEVLKGMLPEDMHNRAARHQMCQPAPADATFPDQWKENYIEVKPVEVRSSSVGFNNSYYSSSDPDCKTPEWKVKRIESMAGLYENDMVLQNLDPDKESWWETVLEFDTLDHLLMDLIRRMSKEDVTWEDVVEYCEYLRDKQEKAEEALLDEEEKKILDAELQSEREQALAMQGVGKKAPLTEAQQAADDADKDEREYWETHGGGYAG